MSDVEAIGKELGEAIAAGEVARKAHYAAWKERSELERRCGELDEALAAAAAAGEPCEQIATELAVVTRDANRAEARERALEDAWAAASEREAEVRRALLGAIPIGWSK